MATGPPFTAHHVLLLDWHRSIAPASSVETWTLGAAGRLVELFVHRHVDAECSAAFWHCRAFPERLRATDLRDRDFHRLTLTDVPLD